MLCYFVGYLTAARADRRAPAPAPALAPAPAPAEVEANLGRPRAGII